MSETIKEEFISLLFNENTVKVNNNNNNNNNNDLPL